MSIIFIIFVIIFRWTLVYEQNVTNDELFGPTGR